MRHCLVMANKIAKLTFINNKLITTQGVTPSPYLGCVAPTGLKRRVFLFTHRLRSGLLLLHPDGVF